MDHVYIIFKVYGQGEVTETKKVHTVASSQHVAEEIVHGLVLRGFGESGDYEIQSFKVNHVY